ncbi:MAG TPA: potassium channel family protein, partial [Sphingomicrobium sp.]|nr:potassium channel family protein [Sphingomicrobium sp.]
MLIQLILAAAMSLVTVGIHLTGLAFLVRMLRSRHRLVRPLKGGPVVVLLIATISIFVIHTSEIWLYALLYVQLDALGTFESALYFSTVTYSSIGYGDVLLDEEWRVFGAIEGATGLLMIGWSTAFLVSLLGQLKLLTHDWLTPEADR